MGAKIEPPMLEEIKAYELDQELKQNLLLTGSRSS